VLGGERKKEEEEKEKNKQAPGASVVAVWGCSRYD